MATGTGYNFTGNRYERGRHQTCELRSGRASVRVAQAIGILGMKFVLKFLLPFFLVATTALAQAPVQNVVADASGNVLNSVSINFTAGKLLVGGVPVGGGGAGSTTLSGLTDVSISGPVLGQVLTYDNATSKWKNQSPAFAGFGIASIKGSIDCSSNPNYPSANAGDAYRITVDGKIGGASGRIVYAGDLILCLYDSTPSGDEATVGLSWFSTYAKLSSQRLLGRGSAGVGGIEEVTIGQNLTLDPVTHVLDNTFTGFNGLYTALDFTGGNITSIPTRNFSDINGKPTTLGGYGITDAQPHAGDLDSLSALTGTNNIYYRSAANTWTSVTIGTGLAFSSGTLSVTGSVGVSDAAFSSAWNGIAATAPSQNAAYDYLHSFTTNDDGKVNVLGGQVTESMTTATTNARVQSLLYGLNSSGTPANGFGQTWKFTLADSTTADQDAARIGVSWTNATHTNQTAKIALAPALNGTLTDTFFLYGSGGMALNADVDPGAGKLYVATGLEIGNSSDTTVTRLSAGILAVEGDQIASQALPQTWTSQHSFSEARTKSSSISATLDDVQVTPQTTTITGGTTIATATGFNKVSLYQPTYTDSSAVTVTNAATLYIADAPAATGSVTITNPYALWVDNGAVRIDGTIELGNISDTTLSRSAAGTIAVEGVDVLTTSNTKTVTNKTLTGSTNTIDDAMTVNHDLTAVPNQTGGWKEYFVSGSPFTTTNNTLTTITGLTTDTLSASTKYEFELVLDLTNAADTNGMKFGFSAGGSGSAATVFSTYTANSTTTAAASGTVNSIDTASSSSVVAVSSGEGIVFCKGMFTTRSGGTPTMIVQILKVTGNTAQVNVGSVLRIKKAHT